MKHFILREYGSSQQGFTLIELMVAMAVSSMFVAVVYMAFTTQQRSYVSQDQVAEMQQKLRAGMRYMGKELVMTGYNPGADAPAGILSAAFNQLNVTMDLNGDKDVDDPGEKLLYKIDAGNNLCRDDVNAGSGCQPLIDNVQAIEFYYTLENGTKKLNPSAPELDFIRAVQVTLLAQSRKVVLGYSADETFQRPSGGNWTGNADGRRRAMLSSTIHLRNMGLN